MASPTISLVAVTTRPMYPITPAGGLYFMFQYQNVSTNQPVQFMFPKQQPSSRWDSVLVSNLPLVTPAGPAASGSRNLYISYDNFTFHIAKAIPDDIADSYTGGMDDYKNAAVSKPVYVRPTHSAFNFTRITSMIAFFVLIGSIVAWFFLRKK